MSSDTVKYGGEWPLSLEVLRDELYRLDVAGRQATAAAETLTIAMMHGRDGVDVLNIVRAARGR